MLFCQLNPTLLELAVDSNDSSVSSGVVRESPTWVSSQCRLSNATDNAPSNLPSHRQLPFADVRTLNEKKQKVYDIIILN